MRREDVVSRSVAVMIIAVIAFPGLMIGGVPVPAAAAPTVIDHLDGNKTVSWDFSNPVDYTTANMTLGGKAELSQLNGQIVHDSDQDFSDNNLTYDSANLTISGGSVATKQVMKNEVENDSFGNWYPWEFVDSFDGNVTSEWNLTGLTGQFSHTRAAPPLNQFDQMDPGAGSIWVVVPRGPNPQHSAAITDDTVVYHEPTGSVRLDIQFKNQITGILAAQRTGSFNWLAYNTLSFWLNTTYTGPQVIDCYVNLYNGSAEWNSSKSWVTPGWKQYDVDISSFAPRVSLTRLEIRFTNVTSTTLPIWIDDLWLYHYDSISQTAVIYQNIWKESFTDNLPGTVLMSFNYRSEYPLNLFANLAVRINSTLLTIPAINVSAGTAWTPRTFDVSSILRAAGAYNVSFSLSVYFKTPFASFIRVQIDDVSITVPTYRGGVYETKSLDLGKAVFFDQVSWTVTARPGTWVDLEIRGGWSAVTSDGSWTPWTPHASSPMALLGGSTGRFLQYRVTLVTTNVSLPVSFDRIQFTFHRYRDAGSVETTDYVPPEQLLGWRMFNAVRVTRPGTSVSYEASDDVGAGWVPAVPGTSLSALTGLQIRIRASVTAINTTATPTLLYINVTYEFAGPLASIKVSPTTWSGTADEQVQFTATGRDTYGRNVPVTPTWTEDDPNGSVDSLGLYSAGRIGSHVVCASAGGKIDCANVTVSTGVLFDIMVSPATTAVPVGGFQNFSAVGEDFDGNPIILSATEWLTDVGSFRWVGAGSALFVAKGTPDTGHVSARQSGITGNADVDVQSSASIYINGNVPNIVKPEDSPPWTMDLTNYLPTGPSPSELKWCLIGRDPTKYSVYGENSLGQHVLTFSPVKDAWGNNSVTLTLENATGATASQTLWVNLTPENDAPAFYDVPDLTIKYDSPYVFDYSPYVDDIDTPRSRLVLTTNDQFRARVVGLKVNYSYDSTYNGQTVLVRLRISDGEKASETIQVIKVGNHAPPTIIKTLPEVTMLEDQVLNDAFPEPLSQYFTDPDGEPLSYRYDCSHVAATFWSVIPEEVHVRLTPEPDWFGTDLLTIRANDTVGVEVAQTVIVRVTSVDDPPVLAWTDDVTVRFDVPYRLDLSDYVSDVDTPLSGLTMSTNRTDLVNVETFTLDMLLPRYLLGSVTSVPLSITLTDGIRSAWSNITIHVGDNYPPEPKPGTGIPDVSFNEDEQANGVFSLDDYFVDPDFGPQALTYTITSSKVTGSVDPIDHTVSFSAAPNWNGQEVVHVKATDGQAYAMSRLTVRVVPVDDAPTVSQIPDQNLGYGGAIAIDLRKYVHDIDNNITELEFTSSSPRAVCVGYMLVLDYRAGSSSETVTLTASDGLLENSVSFKVTVIPTVPPDGGGGAGLLETIWPWLVVALIAIIAAAAIVLYNKVRTAVLTVEDVFLLGKDGRLIMHTTRHQRADRDEDTLAGMLSAIMAFIRESFEEDEEDFKSFTFGDRQVHVQRDTYFYFVAIYAGEPPESAQDSIAAITRDIEKGYRGVLEDWRGDASEIRELRAFTDAFVARKRYRRGDWKRHAKKAR